MEKDPATARDAISTRSVELAVALLFVAAGAVVIIDSLRVGITWAEDGPRLRVDAQQHVGLSRRLDVVRDAGIEGEQAPRGEGVGANRRGHAQLAAQHVDRHEARRAVLGQASAVVEGEEDETHRAVVRDRDLPMSVDGRVRLAP